MTRATCSVTRATDNKTSATSFSGDSKGQIIEWGGGGAAWSLAETINPPELKVSSEI